MWMKIKSVCHLNYLNISIENCLTNGGLCNAWDCQSGNRIHIAIKYFQDPKDVIENDKHPNNIDTHHRCIILTAKGRIRWRPSNCSMTTTRERYPSRTSAEWPACRGSEKKPLHAVKLLGDESKSMKIFEWKFCRYLDKVKICDFYWFVPQFSCFCLRRGFKKVSIYVGLSSGVWCGGFFLLQLVVNFKGHAEARAFHILDLRGILLK